MSENDRKEWLIKQHTKTFDDLEKAMFIKNTRLNELIKEYRQQTIEAIKLDMLKGE